MKLVTTRDGRAGRLTAQKRFDRLLRAFAAANPRDARLRIAGDGEGQRHGGGAFTDKRREAFGSGQRGGPGRVH